MRQRLRNLAGAPTHFGWAYDVHGPIDDRGSYEADRDKWLDECAGIAVDPDYGNYFALWERSFLADPGYSWTVRSRLTSRLLVGVGNPSASEAGLTVHRAWGVPMIPGPALKGLASSYAEAVYGA